MKNLLFLVVLIICIGFAVSFSPLTPEKPDRYSLHLVRPGDTLWRISEQYLPDIDPRIGLKWIAEANGLNGAIIQAGDVLNVPDWNGSLQEPLGPRYSSLEAAIAAENEMQKLLFSKKEASRDGTQ